MYSYGPPHMAVQKDDQHEHTFSSYVRIRDNVLTTYLGWWTIGRSGERGSGISVLPARYDDDDGIYIYIYIYKERERDRQTDRQRVRQRVRCEYKISEWRIVAEKFWKKIFLVRLDREITVRETNNKECSQPFGGEKKVNSLRVKREHLINYPNSNGSKLETVLGRCI